jgi:hypothetical protein
MYEINFYNFGSELPTFLSVQSQLPKIKGTFVAVEVNFEKI